MTEKELSSYQGKNLRIHCTDSSIIEGFCCLFNGVFFDVKEKKIMQTFYTVYTFLKKLLL